VREGEERGRKREKERRGREREIGIEIETEKQREPAVRPPANPTAVSPRFLLDRLEKRSERLLVCDQLLLLTSCLAIRESDAPPVLLEDRRPSLPSPAASDTRFVTADYPGSWETCLLRLKPPSKYGIRLPRVWLRRGDFFPPSDDDHAGIFHYLFLLQPLHFPPPSPLPLSYKLGENDTLTSGCAGLFCAVGGRRYSFLKLIKSFKRFSSRVSLECSTRRRIFYRLRGH
jgi:hypothetical protein